MNRSETIGALSLALSKCQGMIKGAVKDSANPFFKSVYADLESVWAACREPLALNELAVIQLSDETDKGIIVDTMLTHSSGEWISGRMFIPISAKLDAQTVGSACTYARRYSLQMIVGIAPIDDDGNAAAGKDSVKSVTQAPKQATTPLKTAHPAGCISAEQNKLLRTLLTENKIDVGLFKNHFEITSSTDIKAADMNKCIEWIEANKTQEAA